LDAARRCGFFFDDMYFFTHGVQEITLTSPFANKYISINSFGFFIIPDFGKRFLFQAVLCAVLHYQ
jgi:hypothetical protein